MGKSDFYVNNKQNAQTRLRIRIVLIIALVIRFKESVIYELAACKLVNILARLCS